MLVVSNLLYEFVRPSELLKLAIVYHQSIDYFPILEVVFYVVFEFAHVSGCPLVYSQDVELVDLFVKLEDQFLSW